jgi:flavodoxin
VATVAIVTRSRAGNTWHLAEAVRDSARIANARVHLIKTAPRESTNYLTPATPYGDASA